MPVKKSAALVFVSICALFGCSNEAEKKKPRPAPIISVAQVQTKAFVQAQESVGTVDPQSAPMIAAEIAGEVVKIYADTGDAVRRGQKLAELDAQDYRLARDAAAAEVRRVEALLSNQARLAQRYRELTRQNFMSPVRLEETEAQLAALQQQLNAARIQLQQANRNLNKGSITAPADGRVEQRLASVGDFVAVGKPLFQLAAAQNSVRVILPFPETAAAQIRRGQKVLLTSPAADAQPVVARISEIRPLVGAAHSVEAIAEASGASPWRAGASLNGRVVIAERSAIAAPEPSIVLRPVGEIVYVIHNGKAQQRIVKTGARQDGFVEVVSGLSDGETVAVDGAAFLTQDTAVKVQNETAAQK